MNIKATHWYLIIGMILALIPSYLIRFNQSTYMWFYDHFTTYIGDYWNFFANYLGKGLHFPPEYPAGLRFFYEIMGFYKYHDYTWFFTVNAIIIMLFAIGITYLICLILKNDNTLNQISNVWYFWIFAPSFMFYSIYNYDLPVVFLIILAVYLFLKEKYYGAIVSLAVGVVVKVFPVFLLPVFILKSPKKYRIPLIIVFFVVVVLLNLPYAIMDFSSWIYPYVWQISSNLSTGPDQGTYWWIIYPLFGKFTGWLSLILFGVLYYFTYNKLKSAPFINLCLAVILIFLLTDRIYSPQYNLYLLPFLALVTYKIDKRLFYLIEIPNVLIVFFCFFLKGNVVYLQILVFIRYFALIGLYVMNYKYSKLLRRGKNSE